ncbi:MAG: AAA family ATPase [Desulfovibrionaceae bacterium]|nr:AAA family ATPase [Desulfovibrionaceae bacterium]
MKNLPIGTQNFEIIREENNLYIDKTRHIIELITTGRKYFIARPQQFGKSVLLSTIDAIFSKRFDLFKGTFAEGYVKNVLIPHFQY